jgi:hypothetical protein
MNVGYESRGSTLAADPSFYPQSQRLGAARGAARIVIVWVIGVLKSDPTPPHNNAAIARHRKSDRHVEQSLKYICIGLKFWFSKALRVHKECKNCKKVMRWRKKLPSQLGGPTQQIEAANGMFTPCYLARGSQNPIGHNTFSAIQQSLATNVVVACYRKSDRHVERTLKYISIGSNIRLYYMVKNT